MCLRDMSSVHLFQGNLVLTQFQTGVPRNAPATNATRIHPKPPKKSFTASMWFSFVLETYHMYVKGQTQIS